MKRLYTILSLCMALALGAQGALTSSFYKTKSILSEGKWVKVGVKSTGVYSIPYSTLEQMGFKDPSKVSVYGRGGRMMPEDFTDNTGLPTFEDEIQPVSVYHYDGNLYFYGLGPEEISFKGSSKYDTKGYFERKSLNIYSNFGYYFLTDHTAPQAMAVKNYDNSATSEVTRAMSYVYHELDSLQNAHNTGQLFWGELLGNLGSPRREWKVSMPDADASAPGVMECVMYFSNDESAVSSGATVSYGFKDTESPALFKYATSVYTNFTPYANKVAQIDIPGNKGTVFTEFNYSGSLSVSNLDYWVVTYQRSIPTMKDADGRNVNQQLMVLPDIAKSRTAFFTLPNSSTLKVMDVSNSKNPKILNIKDLGGGNGAVSVINNEYGIDYPQLVVFDVTMPQLQISLYEDVYSPVANQNLHQYAAEGADYIIVSTPALRPYAERIAELHREHGSLKVVVATTEECYNEFSQGVPDPMAIRSFAKMLHLSPRKPKNILLFGPLYGDFRGLKVERNPLEGIIAYQSPQVSIPRGAHNINDFYGCMSDQYRTDYYERNIIDMGVGILPVKFAAEAEIMVNKIEDYLTRTDFAYYLNKYTAVGGIGDAHTHDGQINDISEFIRNLDFKSTILTPLSIDSYGYKEAHNKFVNQLNEGCIMMSYFGHGAEQFLGKDRYFFSAGDVFALRNRMPSLACFAGCQITNTDRGMRGLGETIVTATPYGCIGSIVSARETWSGQNLEFFKQFFISYYNVDKDLTSQHNYKPTSIGEIYARVKTYQQYSNELAYQLMCDPALIIPSANRSVTLDNQAQIVAVPGETLTFSGHIDLNSSRQIDPDFNGEVVVRLMEPAKSIPVGNLITGEKVNNLNYTYRDQQISMGVGQVKDGKFTATLHVPYAYANFNGFRCILYVSAYDPSTRTGAGQGVEIPMTLSLNSASTESLDKTAPVIEKLVFNQADASIDLTVSDNLALNMTTNPLTKGLYLFIDGVEVSGAHFSEPAIEHGRPAFSKNVALEGLTYSEHSARLKVKDAAGNFAEKEIKFVYQPEMALYTIVRSEDSVKGNTVIEFADAAPAQATLVVLDSKGNEVYSRQFSGNRVEWNHSGFAPGHYKAYVIENGAGSSKGHSETIDIPVI